MNNFIVVKPNKVSFKGDPLEINESMYIEVQKECKSINAKNVSRYSKIIPIVALRTTYSNEILSCPNGKCHMTYTVKMPEGDKNLYNLCILSGKQFLLDALKNGEVSEDILSHSVAYPIGMTFQDNIYYLLTHIVIDEQYITDSNFVLNEGYSLKPIVDAVASDTVEEACLKRMILIKKESETNE